MIDLLGGPCHAGLGGKSSRQPKVLTFSTTTDNACGFGRIHSSIDVLLSCCPEFKIFTTAS